MCSCFFWFFLSCTRAVCNVPRKDCEEQSVQSSFFFFQQGVFQRVGKPSFDGRPVFLKEEIYENIARWVEDFQMMPQKKAEVALEMWALRLVLWCRCIKSSGRCLEGVFFRFLPTCWSYLPAVQQEPHQKPAAVAFFHSAVCNFKIRLPHKKKRNMAHSSPWGFCFDSYLSCFVSWIYSDW